MIKLNDDGIFVGEIKQLLATFNLPMCKVGSAYPAANEHFLTKDAIRLWEETSTPDVFRAKKYSHYVFGAPYLNLTSTLPINNMIYDRQTHRYLGKFLRFLRDYSGINLMSMYNCWDGDVVSLPFSLQIPTAMVGGVAGTREVVFEHGNNNASVYKVPIGISSLSISVHSSSPIEMCLYIDNYQPGFKPYVYEIAKQTYKKRRINGVYSYNPFAVITSDVLKKFIWEHISELYLVIKTSSALMTSIVVLEGEYVDKNDIYQQYISYKPVKTVTSKTPDTTLWAMAERVTDAAKSDIIWEALYSKDSIQALLVKGEFGVIESDTVESGFQVISQLLTTENTTGNFLLGDRLIEYLSGNAITNLSPPYEIKRVQNALNALRPGNAGAYNLPNNIDAYRDKYGPFVSRYNIGSNPVQGSPRFFGIWHHDDLQNLRSIVYASNLHLKADVLGYLDKDLENVLKGVLDNVEV